MFSKGLTNSASIPSGTGVLLEGSDSIGSSISDIGHCICTLSWSNSVGNLLACHVNCQD